jgi:sulfite exporter TauE/SafE
MTLLLAVLGASLLGSVHCAAMCGGFTCLYASERAPSLGGRRHGRSQALLPHAAYNGGRLVSYLTLGAIAGSIGGGIDHLGALARVSRLAAIVSGALLAIWGANTLLTAAGFRSAQPRAPRIVQVAMGELLVRLRGYSATVRGVATGLLTTLLPCGWLYAFAATAGGTGNARDGMLVMVAFWLGTLPIMLAIGAGAQRAFGAFQRRLPLVAAGVAVLVGVLTMMGRLSVRPAEHAGHVRVAEAGHERH